MVVVTSPSNSPVWPPRTQDGAWRMAVDYHKLTEALTLLTMLCWQFYLAKMLLKPQVHGI
jgi:hypothetical protein